MCRIVNQENTTDVTLSGAINHNTNQTWPTFHIMVWRLKLEKTERLKLNIHVDKIKCFMLLIIIKILLFGILQEWNYLFYLLMNQTYVMVTYSLIMFSQSSWFEYQSVKQCAFKEGCCTTNQKPRSVSPHKLKLKTTTNNKKSRLKNKKFRSVSTQLRRGSTEPNSNTTNTLQQHLFYTNKNHNNYPFIDVSTSIPIVTWKPTKNCSRIISNRPLSSCSSYFGNN